MAQKNDNENQEIQSTQSADKRQFIGTITSTTWRMFVPTIIGIVGGYKLDQKLDTLPWLFILGTVLGCLLAGVLVVRLLKKI